MENEKVRRFGKIVKQNDNEKFSEVENKHIKFLPLRSEIAKSGMDVKRMRRR